MTGRLASLLARPTARYYTVALSGALSVFVAEQLVGDAKVRCAIADLSWSVAALFAIVGTAVAAARTRGLERPAWLLLWAGACAWFLGQLGRDLYEIAAVPTAPLWIDTAFMTAAPLWTIGLVVLLRRRSGALPMYGLALDVGAVILTIVAAIAMFLSQALVSDVARDPGATAVAVAYPVLYVAATAAALSVLWAAAPQLPRSALLSLFIGFGLNALAFTLYMPASVQGNFAAGTPLDMLWIVGMAAIGISGAQWIERRSDPRESGFSSSAVELSRLALPGLVAAASAFLLVYSDLSGMHRVELVVDATVAAAVLVVSLRAGVALYANLRLGQRERRRAEELAVLYEVGLATAGEVALEDLAELIAREATSLTQTDGAMVSLADRGGAFVVRAQHNARQLGFRSSVGEPLKGIALDALRTRDLVVACEYAAHPDANPKLADLIASAIAAPLVAHGAIVGTLTAYARRPRDFNGETRRLVRLYAAQAAIAIRNADLLAETKRLARDDDLTGVLNRRSLLERLDDEISSASRHGDIFGVVLCDVDGLKDVNDTAGHLVGNEVLRSVARVLREATRAEDIVARFGGDEFVLLLPRAAALPAQALVGRIAAQLREERYTWAGRPHALPRASFGISWFPEDGRDADALIGVADSRMYEDKARARLSRSEAAAGDD